MKMPGIAGLGRVGSWSVFSTTPPAWAYFLDFTAYPLLILMCFGLAAGDRSGASLLAAAGLALLGFAIWTLVEYLLHRFVLHHVPLFKPAHLAHHHAPRDLIGTPTIVSVAIFFAAVLGPLWLTLGLPHAAGLSTGLLAGYFAYVSVHYALHHFGTGGIKLVQRLKRNHAVHHHHATSGNYGVTTAFWDRVFGTLR